MPAKKETIVKPIEWMDRIYSLVRNIPKGKVTSYGALAEAVGMRTTARMVGWAMNACHHVKPPIPAHRVVNRNGMLSGRHHFPTPTLMQELLEAEGIHVEDHSIVNFEQHFWSPQ